MGMKPTRLGCKRSKCQTHGIKFLGFSVFSWDKRPMFGCAGPQCDNPWNFWTNGTEGLPWVDYVTLENKWNPQQYEDATEDCKRRLPNPEVLVRLHSERAAREAFPDVGCDTYFHFDRKTNKFDVVVIRDELIINIFKI